MKEKIKLKQAVLVEGRYDKIKLDAVLDALIIPVHGFSVFTDEALKSFILKLARERGVIVLMDSDAAGFKIRGFLRGIIPKGQLTDVYIPDVIGKEKRKRQASKEGKLGVEGIDVKILRLAFEEAGITGNDNTKEQKEEVTPQDFLVMGFSGGANSSELRKKLYNKLDLPERLSTKAALNLINRMMSKDEFLKLADEI